MRFWWALGVELLLHEDAHAPERPARAAKDVWGEEGGGGGLEKVGEKMPKVLFMTSSCLRKEMDKLDVFHLFRIMASSCLQKYTNKFDYFSRLETCTTLAGVQL